MFTVRLALNVNLGRHHSVAFRLSSPDLLVLDPLALDAMSKDLRAIGEDSPAMRRERLAVARGPLEIGLFRVEPFVVGQYEVGLNDLEAIDRATTEGHTIEIDTGAAVFVDVAYLAPVAAALTWDRYEQFLQSAVGDDSVWEGIIQEVGGPYFGLLIADADYPFNGDGSYRLRPGFPKFVIADARAG
jgi:hypothetical protein